MRQQFCIAAGFEDVALALQLAPALAEVEQFAVEDDRDRTIFIRDGLLAIGPGRDATGHRPCAAQTIGARGQYESNRLFQLCHTSSRVPQDTGWRSVLYSL